MDNSRITKELKELQDQSKAVSALAQSDGVSCRQLDPLCKLNSSVITSGTGKALSLDL